MVCFKGRVAMGTTILAICVHSPHITTALATHFLGGGALVGSALRWRRPLRSTKCVTVPQVQSTCFFWHSTHKIISSEPQSQPVVRKQAQLGQSKSCQQGTKQLTRAGIQVPKERDLQKSCFEGPFTATSTMN